MRSAASAIRSSVAPEVAPGHISVLPNPEGLDRMADLFDDYAKRASAQIAELQGPEEDE